MKAGFFIVDLNLFSICHFFYVELHSFTMLAAVWYFTFLALFYIFTQTSIIIFIAHSIYIVGSVDGHNIVVKCVIFLDIAPWSILKFVAGSP